MSFRQQKFERAVKHETDEDIREAARELDRDSFHREENAEFIAQQLREHKCSQVRNLGNETTYDGIMVRVGTFARIRVDDEPEPEPKHIPLPDDDEDDDEEESMVLFNDDEDDDPADCEEDDDE
ncbi:MAG: hypothetical protein RBG13Loki_2113 [Promethearchaeota archaeon CR_4]|nr:MAG: hypothetical protein RBG13Loki_2113 [Candidatus Lokiarchaeota archaeon CR_4]